MASPLPGVGVRPSGALRATNGQEPADAEGPEWGQQNHRLTHRTVSKQNDRCFKPWRESHLLQEAFLDLPPARHTLSLLPLGSSASY